jgi:hypothetical protein
MSRQQHLHDILDDMIADILDFEAELNCTCPQHPLTHFPADSIPSRDPSSAPPQTLSGTSDPSIPASNFDQLSSVPLSLIQKNLDFSLSPLLDLDYRLQTRAIIKAVMLAKIICLIDMYEELRMGDTSVVPQIRAKLKEVAALERGLYKLASEEEIEEEEMERERRLELRKRNTGTEKEDAHSGEEKDNTHQEEEDNTHQWEKATTHQEENDNTHQEEKDNKIHQEEKYNQISQENKAVTVRVGLSVRSVIRWLILRFIYLRPYIEN